MNDKEKYLQAMKDNKGKFDEIMLGESLGFDEDKTMKTISQLLSEFRIDYKPERHCNYSVKKIII